MKIFNFVRKNYSLLLIIVGVFAVRWSLAEPYHVPTGSMEPTIHVGDRILANKAAYSFKLPFTSIDLFPYREPKRGEVVLFRFPKNPSIVYVKRLVGLPGDHIRVKNGFVQINGMWVEGSQSGAQAWKQHADDDEFFYLEQWGEHLRTIRRQPGMARDEEISLTVPEGQYFMMGDNRDNSYDSRGWGFVPRENIIGNAVATLFNFTFNHWTPHLSLERTGASLN
jgi:signal peptidase I